MNTEPWFEARDAHIVVGDTRTLIRTVAERWREQYGAVPTNPEFAAILQKLRALDAAHATAAEVEAIIGNKSWTQQLCYVCDRYVELWVRLGEPPDYESSTIYACLECLNEAISRAENSHE